MLNDNISPETKRKLAQASDTPAEILEQLGFDSDRIVRSLADTSEKLTADSDSTVRYEVAKNSYTTVEVLQILTTNKYHTVATAAKERLQKTKTRRH